MTKFNITITKFAFRDRSMARIITTTKASRQNDNSIDENYGDNHHKNLQKLHKTWR